MEFIVGNKHNILAHLDPTSKNAADYVEIINFFKRSRIFYAISTPYTPYLSHQKQFWESAVLDSTRDPIALVGRINGKEVAVTEQSVREALKLNDRSEDPIKFSKRLVRGFFKRIKYAEPIKKEPYLKSGLCRSYRLIGFAAIVRMLSTMDQSDASKKQFYRDMKTINDITGSLDALHLVKKSEWIKKDMEIDEMDIKMFEGERKTYEINVDCCSKDAEKWMEVYLSLMSDVVGEHENAIAVLEDNMRGMNCFLVNWINLWKETMIGFGESFLLIKPFD